VRAARSKRADVLVLGTHGRTGLPRFFLGSVAARVLATAPCPVLTVRGR
jgi:nucleotide-binding universal stress UspA family protein